MTYPFLDHPTCDRTPLFADVAHRKRLNVQECAVRDRRMVMHYRADPTPDTVERLASANGMNKQAVKKVLVKYGVYIPNYSNKADHQTDGRAYERDMRRASDELLRRSLAFYARHDKVPTSLGIETFIASCHKAGIVIAR